MDDRRVRSVQRVFSTSTATATATTTRLSIADATVARFTPCGAIWFYDKPEGLGLNFDANDPVVYERFQRALSETLDEYPHYAGQLRWSTAEDVKGAVAADDTYLRCCFLGRPVVTYGCSLNDPGVELVFVEDSREIKTIVPSLEERKTPSKRIWKASGLRQEDFLPGTKLAFSNLAEFEGLPGAAVQITAFKCGGFAIGVKITHCLSDAICLLQFVHSWADRTRRLFNYNNNGDTPAAATDDDDDMTRIKPPKALFNPSLLDVHAKLTPQNHSELPDSERLERARALPMHRFDWWATDASGYPSWATASSRATQPPPEELSQLKSKLKLSPSTHPPWPTWDMSAPVEHVQIRFSREEIDGMKKKAVQSSSLREQGQNQMISRQDALLAHLWILINRARARRTGNENLDNDNRNENKDKGEQQEEGDEETVYLNITLGLRNRVEPTLPETFAGSPILLAHVALPKSSFSFSDTPTTVIGAVATSIRKTMARFTPDAVSDYLYEAAHEISPQRLWQGFLGSRHVLVTSWVRARAYEVDFLGDGEGKGKGKGERKQENLARYVQSHMPLMDGLLQLMDVADTGDFDVSLALEKNAMQRLLADPMLRAYEIS